MKMVFVSILLLLFSSNVSLAQKDTTNLYFSIDDLTPCVAFLNQCVSGTGFFVASGKNLYLVTASHVAKKMNDSAIVILRGDKDTPIKLSLTDLVSSNKINWLIHSREDVAILKLNPSPFIMNRYLQRRFLPLRILVDSLTAPLRDIPITVLGFPLGIGWQNHFSPLTLQTHAASGLVELKRGDNHKYSTFFVLENPSVGGYSGAPCFDVSIYRLGAMTTTGSGTKCYGIMHGTASDDTGGKLALVVPSKYIFDLIGKLEK